jgi:putative Mg2+ transporter-C (MgtC) family protein
MNVHSFDYAAAGLRLLDIGIAYVLALPIGWSWERIRHNSGLRTFPLVAVASCSYVLVAQHALGAGSQNLDKVIQGLMTGMGFIGGGAIFKHGANVRGTATAASMWCVGALGGAVAFGAYDMAIILGLVNLLTLEGLRRFKVRLDTRPQEEDEL